MSKIVKKIVNTCSDCPYYSYNSYYERSYDSGYDCDLAYKRIIDDGDINLYHAKLKIYLDSQKTLFPLPKEEKPESIYKIPEWCPLENYQEDDLK